MADWKAIETEYITTSISYRKLADKHGVHKDTIARKAKAENWGALRRQHADRAQTKVLDADIKQKVSRAERLQTVADKLLRRVERVLDMEEELLIAPQNMKHLSGVLKDIKEIQMIRSDADKAEQEARIANLRKMAQRDDDSKDVRIEMTDEVVDYSG